MLKEIHIRNLVTIEEQSLSLHPGCTMITGETGAGKSIFIEAIELALGARGSVQMIRAQKDQADIHLCCDISKEVAIIDWLKEANLYENSEECIIRRILTRDGRSRSTINGLPVTLQQVRVLASLLFDLHEQYAERGLFQSDAQRDILDRYGGCETRANRVRELAREWHALSQEITDLQHQLADRDAKEAALRMQYEELSALNAREGEWESLEKEQRQLSHLADILTHTKEARLTLINDDEHHVMGYLKQAQLAFKAIQTFESRAPVWLNTLETAKISLADLADELHHYLESTELDPERLQIVESRISQWFHLARKYQTTPQNLPSFIASLSESLNQFKTSDVALKTLLEKQNSIALQYKSIAKELSKARIIAAEKLSKELTKTMRGLSLPHCEFRILLENEQVDYPHHGLEKIIFMMKTNPDAESQILSKILSGGELSRVSLAIHLALSHRMAIPTLIFDEIDVGVGGATAEKIGKLLQQLGKTYQIFCVTHQAQVAGCGHHHLLVEKKILDNHTFTQFKFLSHEEKIHEMARMLGGETITTKALSHAKEMLCNS